MSREHPLHSENGLTRVLVSDYLMGNILNLVSTQMSCRCGSFYVSKTIRPLKKRLNDHVYYALNGKMITPVSRHLDLYHFDTSYVSFIVLERIPKDPRGGNWDRRDSMPHAIERLNATCQLGLNEVCSYKPFL